jgi:hypothetical protein
MKDIQATRDGTDRRKPLWPKLLIGAGLGIAGALCGYGVASLGIGSAARWDDEVALFMAAILIAFALITAVTLMVRPRDIPKGCGVLQVIVLGLAGVMFALPIFGPTYMDADLVFGLVAVLLALQSVANVLLWRAADEMLRRVMAETSAVAFWALQGALFLYAAAERLGLVEGITAWGMTGILMGVYLFASVIMSARRGLS